MIQIIGPDNTAEYLHARALHDLIVEEWPEAIRSHLYDIRIVPSAKVYKQRITDIDIVVFINLKKPQPLPVPQPKLSKDLPVVYLYSVCLTIEVKALPPERIQITGNRVDVQYRDGLWHNVSEQAFLQRISLANYLRENINRAPFVLPLIWLRHFPESKLPSLQHNILGGDATWSTFLSRIAATHDSVANQYGGEEIRGIGSYQQNQILDSAELFTKRLVSTKLNRKRIEQVTARLLVDQQYAEKLGTQLLIFRGRGGTGKTVHLLKLAHDLYEQRDARVLFLTYNKALVSDIRRLVTLMGIEDWVEERTIYIQTIHSFLRSLLQQLEILPQGSDDFLENYENYKDKALEAIADFSPIEIRELLQDANNSFAWDYILIDEAQDWPSNERALLFAIYEFHRFVLADGVDQLVRSQSSIDWREGLDRSATQRVWLKKSLRLKSSLCDFVDAFAKAMNLSAWDVLPNIEIHGGSVLVVEGDYARMQGVVQDLITRNSKEGNSPVDMLFCVPPLLVKHNVNAPSYSLVGKKLQEWGYEIWDGVSESEREGYPTDVSQLRIVQYESCRGLEGWIVVNFNFDELYENKVKYFEPSNIERQDLFFDPEQASKTHAAKWLTIPLTRAIDTLVINIARSESVVADALRQASERCPDLVTWIKL